MEHVGTAIDGVSKCVMIDMGDVNLLLVGVTGVAWVCIHRRGRSTVVCVFDFQVQCGRQHQ